MYKFNHLLAPLTSTPKNGTKTIVMKKIKKIGNKTLFRKLVLHKDMEIISEKDKSVYKRCF